MLDNLENKLKIDKLRKKILELLKIEIIQELIYSGLGCLFFIFLYVLCPDLCWQEFYRNAICAIMVIAFFISFIALNQTNPKNIFFKINYKRNIILFTIFNFAILSFLFFQLDFGYSGLSPDNWYRSAYITRMADSGVPQDFAFKGYFAFISPFYWYILALIAKILQIEPYKMIKFGFLFSYYVLPIILYEIWNKIFKKKIAFYATAFFFTFIANYSEIIWIDHLIGYMFFIPFLLYYFENVKNKEFSKKDYIIAGIFGAILFCTFYLYFILIPIYLIVSFFQSYIKKDLHSYKKKLKHFFYIIIFVGLFSSWFWFPLIFNYYFIGYENHQNYFLPNYALDMPFEAYLKFNLLSFILIIGLVFILLKYNKSNILTMLGNILFSIYILYTIGFVGLLIGFPIVHYRVLVLSYYVLIVSFILFYFEFFRLLRKNKAFHKINKKYNIKKIEVILLIIIIFYQNYRNMVELYNSDYYQDSINEKVPKEVEIVAKLDYENKIFLIQYYKVAAFLPIYTFIVNNAHFSHPSGLNNERIRFLQDLADSEDSREFYQKLLESEFGPIHYFYLEPCDDNQTEFLFDACELENYPERLEVNIYFRADLFNNTNYFKKIVISDEIIFKTKY